MSSSGESDIRSAPGGAPKAPIKGLGDTVAVAFATCGGMGRCPVMPGTVGSLLGIPMYLLLEIQAPALRLMSLLALLAISVWAADRAEGLLGRKDPPEVVIDEVVGFVVTMAWMRPTVLALGLGLAFFRALDIAKVPPARWAERRLTGGLGVVGDDVLAGIMGNVGLRLVLWII